MIFYKPLKQPTDGEIKGFAGSIPQYELNFGRVIMALGLVALLIIAAFAAHQLAWADGGTALLQMATAGFAGIFATLLSEKGVARR